MKMSDCPGESAPFTAKAMDQVPAMVHPHLDAIQHNSEGGLYLAASSLTGRHWRGSLWYFDDASTAPNIEKCTAGVDIYTGLNDFRLLSDRQLLLGNDTGSLQLWELKTDDSFSCCSERQEHDGFISAVSINADKSQAATCSQDRRIKLWDLAEFEATDTFTAHHSVVWSVAFHPTEPSIYLSCGQDGRTLLWDLRKPKPASIIDTGYLEAQPSCVVWNPDAHNLFVVGSESGTMCQLDCRKIATTTVLQPHRRFIHKMAFSPARSGWIASASDDARVVVTDLSGSEPSIIWSSNDHEDFVRGLSWDPNTDNKLMSCGWDMKVCSHSVSAKVVTMDTETVKIRGGADLMDTLSPGGTNATNGLVTAGTL